MSASRTPLALAAALILLGACGRTPAQWEEAGKAAAAAGDAETAILDYDRALAHSGPWTAEVQLLKAHCLMDLGRFEPAARSAEESTLGQSPMASRPARVLALQAYAEALDKDEGKRVFGLLGGAAALGDPDILAAAVKLGLANPGTPAASPAAPGAKGPARFNMAQLDAVRVSIGSVSVAQSLDPAQFPYRVDFQNPKTVVKVTSPDGLTQVWRGQDRWSYCLFTCPAAGGKPKRLGACKNGFQPVWAPDSKHILYSAMDWRLEERNLFIYDVVTQKSRRAFNARRKVGALAAWSPDGSKIVYSYQDDVWMMNSDGIGRSLLNLGSRIKKPVQEAVLIAWSGDGNRLAYQMRGDPAIYILELAQKL